MGTADGPFFAKATKGEIPPLLGWALVFGPLFLRMPAFDLAAFAIEGHAVGVVGGGCGGMNSALQLGGNRSSSLDAGDHVDFLALLGGDLEFVGSEVGRVGIDAEKGFFGEPAFFPGGIDGC